MVKFSQEIADEICRVTATTTKGIRKLRKKAKYKHWPNPSTVFDWRKKYPLFDEQYTRAKADQLRVLAEEMLEIADDNRNDYKIVGDKVIPNGDQINRARIRIETRKWLLSKLLPKIYGDKVGEEKSIDNSLLEKLIDKL